MKNKLSLLFLFYFLFSAIGYTQYQTLWDISFKNSTTTPKWLGTGTDNTVRGMAFGTVGGQKVVLVATRAAAVGNQIVILNAQTGDSIGALPKSNIITGGSGAVLCDVEISDDGQIFVGNLTIGHLTSPFKVYRWKNLADTMPKVVLSYSDTIGLGTGASIRLGDKFSVIGKISDGTFRLYAASATSTSGRGNNVIRFKYDSSTDSLVFEKVIKLKIPALTSVASAVVYPVAIGDTNFYWKANGENLRYFDKDGNQLSLSTSSLIPTGANALRVYNFDSRRYVILYRYGSTTENLAFYDVTYGANRAQFIHFTPSLYKNANGNGTGDVGIDVLTNGKVRVYVLSTNNGVATYETDFYALSSIADARKQTIVNDKPDKLNKVVHIKGVVTSKNLDSKGAFFLQDNTAGIYVYRYTKLNWLPDVGDEVEIYGKLTIYNGLSEVIPNCDSIILISKKTRPLPQEVTLQAIKNNGEDLEGKLVVVKYLFKADTSTVFPVTGAKNVKYTNGKGDTIIVRIANNGNAFTPALLPKRCDIIANVGQFTVSSPALDGYQLQPSMNSDFLPPFTENIKVYWELSKNKNNYPFYFDSTASEVSLAFASPKGKAKLYVLSNAKNKSTIYVHNAYNGAFLKKVPIPQNVKYTSLLAINNQLFAISPSDIGNDVKIFKYVDDNLLPVLYHKFTVANKVGYRVKVKYIDYDSSLVITFPVDSINKFYTLKIKNNIKTLDSITYSSNLAVGLPSIEPIEQNNNLTFIFKVPGKPLYQLSATGDSLFAVDSDVVSLEASDIATYDTYLGLEERNFVVSYTQIFPDTINRPTLIFTEVTNGKDYLVNKFVLPKFGNMVNSTGIGSMVQGSFPIFMNNQYVKEEKVLYLLSPNNGIIALGLTKMPDQPMLKFRKMMAAMRKFGDKLPKYFSTNGNTERGGTVAKFGNKWAYFVVTRNGGPKIVVHDIKTGDSLTTLPKPAVDKGYFPINVAGASQEGDLFVANMTLNAQAGSEFTVYRYFTKTSKPDSNKAVISYVSTGSRIGDAISVYGKLSDNSLKVLAGIPNTNKFVVFTTTDNGNTFTPNEITIADPNIKGTVPYACPFDDTTYLFKAYPKKIYRIHQNGTVLEEMPSTLVPDGATTVNMFEKLGRKYVVTYQCDYTGNSNPPLEKAFVYDVTDGLQEAVLVAETPSLGTNKNGNATGNVTVVPNLNKYNENQETEDFDVFVLGTNNGFARFTTSVDIAAQQYDTLKYYDITKPALYKISGGGWYAGPNYYGDLGKAQRFDVKANDKINGFKIFYGAKKVIDDPDTITYYIRNTSGATDPKANGPDKNTMLAKIVSTTDQIDTTFAGNTFLFDNPIVANGPVFVTVEWKPSLNDTFAIVCDQHRGFTGVPVNYRVWELWSDNAWYAWQTGSIYTNINSDLWVELYYEPAPVVGIENNGNVIPETYALYQNYPNPFNPTTTIKFALKQDAMVNLKIYNILGQEVATLVNGHLTAGLKTINFNAANLASGVYIYRLEVVGQDGGKFVNTKKMMLLK